MYSWDEFISFLAGAKLEFPHLRSAILAQAMLECGRGTTKLFIDHGNPFGMHFHDFQKAYAAGVSYDANDGRALYAEFSSPDNALKGYFGWFDHWDHYKGWRDYAKRTALDFLKFIAPHYCPPGVTESWKSRHSGLDYPNYIMQKLHQEAENLLAAAKPKPRATVATWCRVHALSPEVGLEACDDESKTLAVWRGTDVASAILFLQSHPKIALFRPAGFAQWPGPPWDGFALPLKPARLAKFRVALDVGHGITGRQSYDSGAIGPKGEHEHRINEMQANAAAEFLRGRGCLVDVFKYQKIGEGIELEDRGKRGKGYDCLVSVHTNSHNKVTEYSVCLIHKESGDKEVTLANFISEECAKVYQKNSVGAARWSNFSVLVGAREVGVPACISESCFLDSPGEIWPDDAMKFGRAIGKGIEKYLLTLE